MDAIVRSMNTGWGRGARIVLGLVLVGLGSAVVRTAPAGPALVVVGLVPIIMGVWGHCLVEVLVPRPAA